MEHFVFASCNDYKITDFDSLLSFEQKCEEFFDVVLNNDTELSQLFELLGFKHSLAFKLPQSEDFTTLIDFSDDFFPIFSAEEFNKIYEDWLSKTSRTSDMDEYGQLVFIHGYAESWNKNKKRFVLKFKP